MQRTSSPVGLVVLMAMATLALVGCGTARSSVPPTTSTPSTVPSSLPTLPEPEPSVIHWTEPFVVELDNGWVVRDCEGDRTNVCVWDGEAFLGDIELAAGYPLDDPPGAADPAAVAAAWAADMVEHFREDRRAGCAAFTYEGHDVVDAVVGGRAGARSGFTLTDRAGRVVEQVINYYVVVEGSMSIVNVDAYVAEGGCLGPSEYDPSFDPAVLAVLQPHLDDLVAGASASSSG